MGIGLAFANRSRIWSRVQGLHVCVAYGRKRGVYVHGASLTGLQFTELRDMEMLNVQILFSA